MSEEKKHKIFTAADIEKYHKGLLSPAEMHELEKAALEDPFLADALEGYGSARTNMDADLFELQQKLQQRTSRSGVVPLVSKRTSFQWWKVAAAVIIFGGLGFLTLKFVLNRKDNSVAEVKVKKEEQRAAATINGDSTSPKSAEESNSDTNNKVTETTPVKRRTPGKHEVETDDTTTSSAAVVTSVGVVINNKQRDKNESVEAPQNDAGVAPSAAVKTKKAEAAAPQAAVDQRREFAKVQQQMNSFTGRVVDSRNNPLPFANITNTRDNVGTYADARGYFTLISPDSMLNVQVRSIGFENSVIRLKNTASNQVVLQEDKIAPDRVLSLQKTDSIRSRVANMKLEEPEPLDGWTNYNTYMANNINVPDDVRIKHDHGQVQLSFDVNQNGYPVNIKIEKSLCQKCDEEAVRLIRQGPKWRQKNKKAQRVTVSVPFPSE
ncbi:MAG TPA: carboxypeptidase-like regulatory domain-containing protein [Chitinophagaceae bacterium]|nr:carboxypeptidase-like regulatory domain-containing protein [Chitinophagaceae bacterium]